MTAPRHGDGRTYTGGPCLCCGAAVTGTVARSRPAPYLASPEPLGGGRSVPVVLITGERGTHEVPVADLEPDPPPCSPFADYCRHPDAHSSLDCYPRYLDLEYEGSGGPQLMTLTEWKKATR